MKPSREFYIRKGSIRVTPKCGGIEFYLYELAGKPYAMCFAGKAIKPTWHFKFSSPAGREKRIRDAISYQIGRQERIAAEAAAKKAAAAKGHGLEPGLILVSSWGYEQTNVDFYEVIEKIGATMVRIEKIGSQSATDGSAGQSSMSDRVVPDPEKRTGEFSKHKAHPDGRIKIASYASAYLWDGLPRYCSWYA